MGIDVTHKTLAILEKSLVICFHRNFILMKQKLTIIESFIKYIISNIKTISIGMDKLKFKNINLRLGIFIKQ